MDFIKTVLTTAFRVFAILLLLLLISGISFLIIYPNQTEFHLLKQDLDLESKSYNFTLRLFTNLTPPILAQPDLSSEINSIEQISPEQLAFVTNHGEVTTNLEAENATLFVDSVNIVAPIREGVDGNTMKKGPWHFPLSVQPGEKGNSVIIGHRFAEIPPSQNTFFNLDKIEVGDRITVKSDHEDYTYTVVATKVVEKHDRSVLTPTNDYRITLITCHPKWTSDQRLVIIGILDKLHRNI